MKLKYFLILLFLLSFSIENLTFNITHATVRFVSKSGSSTPPYTTWQTAATSIQLCINYSSNGDTIYVANGIYHESLIVNKYLWLIGSSMDSTIVDGTNLANITVDFPSNGQLQNFTIKGKGEGTILTACILCNLTNAIISDCKIKNALTGIGLAFSSSIVNRCLITNVSEGYNTGCDFDTCNSVIENTIILLNNSNRRGILVDGGDNVATNNILLGIRNSNKGIESGLFLNASENILENNTIAGFNINIEGFADDTAIVHNNISSYANQSGFTINSKTDMRNNIVAYNNVGTVGPTNTNSDYNLYWRNNTHTTGGLTPNDIIADPMFVNDTIPVYGGTYDYHLQAYSPAIDAGDPNILDVNGSRSDIGAYGGLLGQSYIYQDLAPRPPVNLSGQYDSPNIKIKWNKNTESDLKSYKIYRDTIPDFPSDSTTFILSLTDTTYSHLIPPGKNKFYYKITAVDNQGNESQPSEELIVIIVSVDEYPVIVNDYRLYQNYPNPFNPSTKIGYKLKSRGYVKVMVYDIKGELVSLLVNKEQNAGYYEVEFSSSSIQHQVSSVQNFASGIYLYRIEVIGEGNIPRFSDMKKMILVK